MSATAQLKTPRQQTLPLPPIKFTSKFSTRGMSAASLRPGDFIRCGITWDLAWIVQNSKKLERVEIEYLCDGHRRTLAYHQLIDAQYLGQGRRRWWWPLLPAIGKKYISEFSRP